ncbi:MAG: DUF2145 domain-containing protein [Azonexus sp.]
MNKYAILLIMLTSFNSAYAGRVCEEKRRAANSVVQALNFAGTVIEKLNKIDPEGHAVYLLGRIGQDLGAYKQKYSHGGFLYKSGTDWQIVHELNGCGSDGSAIYSEGIANFYLDDLFKYESKLIAFNYSVSASLLELLKTAPSKMHGPKYNMLAYPFSTEYQNSNGYLIETIAVADAKSKNILLDNREAAQGYLKSLGFVPAVVEVGTFSRLGARMTRVNIAFDDQIFGQRMAGNIQTVTFDGIVEFLKKNNISDWSIDLQ